MSNCLLSFWYFGSNVPLGGAAVGDGGAGASDVWDGTAAAGGHQIWSTKLPN